jgi:transposase
MIVVADSAMISHQNMEALEASGIKYIVGARLGNLSHSLFTTVVAKTPKTDGANQRFIIPHQNHRSLIVSYSAKRAAKDKSDLNKRLARAESVLSNPSSITSRYKYLRQGSTKQWTIHQEAIAKDKQLEGLKGYVTNATNLTNEEIINKYASLWQVERSFRISKSDLKARPIFHTVREKIEAHMTIVFASLAISKYVELTTGKSIASIVEQVGRVEEVILRDKITGEIFNLYTSISDQETRKLLKEAKLGWVT